MPNASAPLALSHDAALRPFHRTAGPRPGSPLLASGLRGLADRLPQAAGPAALAILLLAAALRLHGIGADGFWKNELFSMTWIRQPVAWLVTEGLRIETNPPLHFLLLKAWTALFGTGEAAARLPSALAAIAAVALTMRLGREMDRPGAGLLAGLLLALTPVQIVYAHEARAYALMPPFALLALLGANRLLRAAASPPGTPPRSAAWLILLGSAGLLHSHATGVFAVVALFSVTFLALRDSPIPGPATRHLLVAGLAAALLASPVLVAMALQAGSGNIEWLPKFGPDTLVILNRYLLIGPMVRTDLGDAGSHYELLAEMALGTLTALVLVIAAFRTLRDGAARALILVVPLLFVLLLAGVSLARPILIPRVALWLSPPICLCVAFILTGRLAWPWRTLAGTLFACCLGVGLWNNVIAQAQHKPDWRALLRDNPATQPDGPTLVAGPHAGPLGVAFYTDGPIARPLRHWTAEPNRPVTTADRLERTTSGATAIDTAGLAALIAAGRGVVLYLDDDDEILIDRDLAPQPWFTQARRSSYAGFVVFTW
jgi:mannosyltransferase